MADAAPGSAAPARTARGSRPSVARAAAALAAQQSEDGSWCYEFEADCTIPAEYVLMAHFMDEPQFTTGVAVDLEARIACYLRARQQAGGGWPLYPGGKPDLSCTVKAYYALKLTGDDPLAPHMRRAREWILAAGGAARANVFTRITLALFGQLPWRGVPVVPVELALLPGWSPVHVGKVSYWSRTVTVPLSVLCSTRARARNPLGIGVPELFVRPPTEERYPAAARSLLGRGFAALDRLGRAIEPYVPGWLRRRAMRRAERWIIERLNGADGLGAIFPAMVNAHEALDALGYPPEHAFRQTTAAALKRLLVLHEDEAYCQPCVSPVWDTGLACLALNETLALGNRIAPSAAAGPPSPAARRDRVLADSAPMRFSPRVEAPRQPREAIRAGLDWLVPRQLTDEPGDWRDLRPDLAGGGWPFQFGNDHYPDVDDTALVGWAMQVFDPARYRVPIERAATWVAGMQSSNGGFGAFDVDNSSTYLNEVPFADHGALLDPPTSDVTARCVAFLSVVDPERYRPVIDRALDFLEAAQEPEGCWFGRWGTNYVYGSWSVLAALEIEGSARAAALAPAAVQWLVSVQRADGGWGESNDSYADRARMGRADVSTSFHTAWALLGLLAAGGAPEPALARGVGYLQAAQLEDGSWYDEPFSCPGFPRVFYLKYHGYSKYFPLWALARYERSRA